MVDTYNRTREPGKIYSAIATLDYDGRGPAAVVEFRGAGGYQALMATLDGQKHLDTFVSMLCETFDVSTIDNLRGLECHALRCWDAHPAMIEGLEAPSGKRFTKTAWARRVFGAATVSTPLVYEQERIRREIRFHQQRVEDLANALLRNTLEYKSWDE